MFSHVPARPRELYRASGDPVPVDTYIRQTSERSRAVEDYEAWNAERERELHARSAGPSAARPVKRKASPLPPSNA